MRNDASRRGACATLLGALVLGCALTSVNGCVHKDEKEPPEKQPPVDSPAQPADAGTGANTRPAPIDSNLVLVRLTSTGQLDTTFGTGGILRVSLGPSGTRTRGGIKTVALDSSGRIVLFGVREGDGQRSDSDGFVARLTPSGALDESFATHGVYALDIAGLENQVRHGLIQPDGKIMVLHTLSRRNPDPMTGHAAVLLRLNADGTRDESFVSQDVEWGSAQTHAVGLQSTGKYVTTGVVLLNARSDWKLRSLRYEANGQRDMSWGTSGTALLDLGTPGTQGLASAVLKDDRVFMAGEVHFGSPDGALVAMNTAQGQRDPAFNADPVGYKFLTTGNTATFFRGAAVSPDSRWVAAAGWATEGSATRNTLDSLLFMAPTDPADGAVVMNGTLLPSTKDDGLTSVAFDTSNKLYAAGFISDREGGSGWDFSMLAVRYNTDGTRDSTFGVDGVATVNVVVSPSGEGVESLLIQPDGKVILAGEADVP